MSKTKRITRQNFDPSKIISIHSFSTTVPPPEHPPPSIPFSFMTVSLEYPEGRCSDRAVCAAGAHGEDGRSPAWLKSAQVVPWILKWFPVLWVFPFLHSHQWNSLSWVRSNFGLDSRSSALAAYIGALNSFPHFKAKKKKSPPCLFLEESFPPARKENSFAPNKYTFHAQRKMLWQRTWNVPGIQWVCKNKSQRKFCRSYKLTDVTIFAFRKNNVNLHRLSASKMIPLHEIRQVLKIALSHLFTVKKI